MTKASLIHLHGGSLAEGPKNHQVNLFSNFVKSNPLPVAIAVPMAITSTTIITKLESRTAISTITAPPSSGPKWKPLGTMFRVITRHRKRFPNRTPTITTTRRLVVMMMGIIDCSRTKRAISGSQASLKVILPCQRAVL